ncbi:MAG: hypothetical protein ACI4U2_06255 [Christensenellaceae bacterium]
MNIRIRWNEWKRSKSFWIGTAFFLAALVVIGFQFASTAEGALWWDEYFTFWLSSDYSFLGIYQMTAGDVHPPLYYWIVRVAFKVLLPMGADKVIVGRCMSVLPFLLLWIYSLIFVRKNFGWLTAGAFAFLITSMPNCFAYASEVRMYTWSIAFVVMALIHVYEVMKNVKSVFSWCMLSFTTLCAAYTQYFALLSVFFLWLGLLVRMAVRCPKQLWRFAAFAAGTVLLYVPWIVKLIAQLELYSSSHGTINWNTWKNYHWFTFGFAIGGEFVRYAMSALCVIVFVLSLIRFKRDTMNEFACISFATWIGVVLVLVVAPGITFHEVFHRYILPAVGCVWLPVTVLTVRLFEKPVSFANAKGAREIAKRAMPAINLAIASVMSVSLCTLAIADTAVGWKRYQQEAASFRIYREAVLDHVEEEDIVVAEEVFARTALDAMLENTVYAYGPTVDDSWFYGGKPVLWEIRDFLNIAHSGNTVWLYTGYRTGELRANIDKILSMAEEAGLVVEEFGDWTQVDSVNCAHSYVYRIALEALVRE